MAKLQQIKRQNDSYVHSVNIPNKLIEDKEWKKGDLLEVTEIENRENSILITNLNGVENADIN